MASWQCLECRTVYPPGVLACLACQARHAAAPDRAARPDYAATTITVLRDLCRDRGLTVRGAKADLAARLAEHDHLALSGT